MAVYTPRDTADLSDMVQAALAAGRGITTADRRLESLVDRETDFIDLSALERTLEHEPSDLVAHVECGIKISELQDRLASSDQFFAAPRSGGNSLSELLRRGDGGYLEAGYGYLRSNVLGLSYFDGKGRLIRCGGRVVKNVTGFDTTKLFIGDSAFGIVVSAHIKLHASPVSTLSLRARADVHVLVDFARSLADLPLAWLELTGNSGDFAMMLGLHGADEMLDELSVLISERSLAAGVALARCELPDERDWHYTIELAASRTMIKSLLSEKLEYAQLAARPLLNRVTLHFDDMDSMRQTAQVLRKRIKQLSGVAREQRRFGVRVYNQLLQVVDAGEDAAARANLLTSVRAVTSSCYHPFAREVI